MDERPRYMISVAAELVGMHPQTLRMYEQKGLVRTKRTAGNTRLYSEADLERLRLIQKLTTQLGLNLAGVEAVLDLEEQLQRMQVRLERLEHAKGLADPLRPAHLGNRRGRLGHVAEIDEVGAHRPESLELVLQRRRVRSRVQRLGEEDVLRDGDGVLQQPVDEDHVRADQGLAAPDRLRDHVADVGDELQGQLAGPAAPLAGAQVRRDEP